MPAFYIICVVVLAMLVVFLTPLYRPLGTLLKSMFEYTKDEITNNEKENTK